MDYVAAVATKAGSNDIEHYGVIGMKWYQHKFGDVDGRAAYAKKGLDKIAKYESKASSYASEQYSMDKDASKTAKKATKLERKQRKLENKAAKAERKANSRNPFRSERNKAKNALKADRLAAKAEKVESKAVRARDRANSADVAARKNKLKTDKYNRKAVNVAKKIDKMINEIDVNTLTAEQRKTAERYSLNLVEQLSPEPSAGNGFKWEHYAFGPKKGQRSGR